MPMHGTEADDVLEALELPGDKSPVGWDYMLALGKPGQLCFLRYPGEQSILRGITHPMGMHKRHINGTCPSPAETELRTLC